MTSSKRLTAKYLPDGRAFLNLGCGHHAHPAWNNLDFSVYARLRRHMLLVRLLNRIGLVSQARYSQFELVPPDIVVSDLRKGIPFSDSTFDLVYNSHLLEHLDREDVPAFLRECYRVLKPQGTLRIVTPDLAEWARRYIDSLATQADNGATSDHEQIVADLLDQMVRRQPTTRDSQPPIVQALERLLLGDSRRSGWAHRWMYDQHTLTRLLQAAGFSDICRVRAGDSRVAGWDQHGLEVAADNEAYKAGSLRIEALKG